MYVELSTLLNSDAWASLYEIWMCTPVVVVKGQGQGCLSMNVCPTLSVSAEHGCLLAGALHPLAVGRCLRLLLSSLVSSRIVLYRLLFEVKVCQIPVTPCPEVKAQPA